jgi:hypothetical protein
MKNPLLIKKGFSYRVGKCFEAITYRGEKKTESKFDGTVIASILVFRNASIPLERNRGDQLLRTSM